MGRAHEVRAASMAKTAAAKSKLNAKWGKAIFVAAKSGVPDPELNQTLKKEIEKAKREQVSADVIKRAIEKAKGGSTESYTSERYEGFGPGNSMWIVDCLTDNHNRTLTAVRTAFSRVGGNLGASGCVTHMFTNQSVFSFEGEDEEAVLEGLLEHDCEVDDIQLEDGVISVFAPQPAYQQVRDALVALYPNVEFLEDHTTWVPSSYVQLAEDHDKQKYERFIEMLDDCDDVQDYYHNIKFDEE
ncbi:MAG: YebC/PmpR family DNA-binding transcriptional regulator [Bacilli bacterium]|nr:YebC/PmpR family DNA-binding transcriptional regulator [Bacilli bacterium]